MLSSWGHSRSTQFMSGALTGPGPSLYAISDSETVVTLKGCAGCSLHKGMLSKTCALGWRVRACSLSGPHGWTPRCA